MRSLFDLLAETHWAEKAVGIKVPLLDEVFAEHLRDHTALFALEVPVSLGEAHIARLVAEVLHVYPDFALESIQAALKSGTFAACA